MKRVSFQLTILIIITACQPDVCQKQILLYIALDGKGNFNIYRNDLKGTETKLTNNPSWDYAPLWNPVSESFSYYAYVDGEFRILRKDLQGNDQELETYGLTEYNLAPNNQWVISEVSIGDNRKLVISDTLGENTREITPNTSYNGRAKWSPNAQKIAYISDRDGNNEVYLYDLESNETRRLTTNETREKYLSWAPDSERLLYSTEYTEEGQPDRNDLFVIHTTSGATTQITNNSYEDSEVAWSPLGDMIAFHSKRDSIDHIFLMNADGTNVRQLTVEAKYHGEPNWALTTCER